MARQRIERVTTEQSAAGRGRTDRRRADTERWLARAALLPTPDRLLVEQVLGEGRPLSQIARMARVPRTTLARRYRRLIRRLDDPLYAFLAGRAELLPPDQRTIARCLVLEGRSLRDTARHLRRSYHHVRTTRIALKQLAAVHGFNKS